LKNIIISVDGPAGSGKGAICKYVSKKWNLNHIDSGILYRRISYLISKSDVDIDDENEIRKLLSKIKHLSFRNNKKLKSNKISNISSKIAVYDFVRKFINKTQKDYVEKNRNNKGFIVDGRDIGSVVFKNANLKLYIDVDVKIRAKRRYKQLIDIGEKSIYLQILKDIKLRDKTDKNRSISPLVVPKGAKIINNNKSFSHTTSQINNLIKEINI
tara:strand:+ start:492 stop:1133 length:642 start_codon:yes stop_codon:yes gene_type:complete